VVTNVSKEHRKVEAICFSEALVVTYKTTRRHNPEYHSPHFYRLKKLKSRIYYMLTEFCREKGFLNCGTIFFTVTGRL
jgi:hypothetical protein